ncbi:hypothetical protein BJ878DRAFT_568255 [Calycina marina]|uniref:Uncharacterized protein n=1 Tax=Calycina marina TaxID=1763456 RepID=A0A9P7Z2E5_9HELO|nr:hypothetical protein BJ878DRAFT_568255 [Calycina marina]
MGYHEDDMDDSPLLEDELLAKKNSNTNIPPWSVSRTKTSKHYRNIVVACALSCLTTALLMFAGYIVARRQSLGKPFLWEAYIGPQRPGSIHCGASVEEAQANDCFFDQLSMQWQPKKCTQSYLDDYMTANDGGAFLYWTDRHASSRIDDPSLHVGGGQIFWTSRRNHIFHCQYNLYRLVHALKTGEYVAHAEEQSVTDHMHHCIREITSFALLSPARDLEITDIITEPSFAFC